MDSMTSQIPGEKYSHDLNNHSKYNKYLLTPCNLGGIILKAFSKICDLVPDGQLAQEQWLNDGVRHVISNSEVKNITPHKMSLYY